MKFFVKAASALAVCGSLIIAAVPAQARGWDSYGGYSNHSGSYGGQWGSQSDYRHDRYDRNRSYRNYSYRSDRSYGYYPGSGYGRGYYGYGNDGAALIIGGLIGAIVGSAIANDHRRSDYYDRGYNGYDRGGYDGYYDGYGY